MKIWIRRSRTGRRLHIAAEHRGFSVFADLGLRDALNVLLTLFLVKRALGKDSDGGKRL